MIKSKKLLMSSIVSAYLGYVMLIVGFGRHIYLTVTANAYHGLAYIFLLIGAFFLLMSLVLELIVRYKIDKQYSKYKAWSAAFIFPLIVIILVDDYFRLVNFSVILLFIGVIYQLALSSSRPIKADWKLIPPGTLLISIIINIFFFGNYFQLSWNISAIISTLICFTAPILTISMDTEKKKKKKINPNHNLKM